MFLRRRYCHELGQKLLLGRIVIGPEKSDGPRDRLGLENRLMSALVAYISMRMLSIRLF